MKKNIKNIFRAIITSMACLVTIVTFGLIYSMVIHNDSSAAGVTLTVKKNETVSIYVHGEYVELISSSETEDVFQVESGTNVKLRAVNEARIFTAWTGLPASAAANAANSTVEFTMSENLTIDCTRRDPYASDFGQYMNNRFVISDEKAIIAMTNILNGSSNIADYNVLFKGFSEYSHLTDAEKIAYIADSGNKTKLTNMVLNGHYLVENNISILTEGFTGIPNFQGVLCGLNNNTKSSIISNISATEESGTQYYGLFKQLGSNALIRNLNITSSIGIIGNSDASGSSVIYAGGLAGTANDPILSNVTLNTKHGIVADKSTIYAGGLAGSLSGGISSHENVVLDLRESSWILTSNDSDEVYAGLFTAVNAGTLKLYCKKATINLAQTSSIITTSNNIYFGGLVGRLNSSYDCSFNDLVFNITGETTFQSNVKNGTSYMGGVIGNVYTTRTVSMGFVRFIGTVDYNTTFLNQITDANAGANLYTGGLFGYINGTNLKATDAFKDSIHEYTVDDKVVVQGDYLFDGNFKFISQNGGKSTSTSYGKTITAGVAAYGYFDINGTSDNITELLIHSEDGQMDIESIQTSQSDNKGEDPLHCLSSLVFGVFYESSFTTKVQYIDVYSTNTKMNSERSIGSTGVGDLRSAGFICYASGTPFDNINLRFNNIKIYVNSLSYAYKLNPDTSQTYYNANSAYCGGFASELESCSDNNGLTNISIEGYDNVNYNSKGATFELNSIQNSTPGQANKNYLTENYCGGLVGQIDKYENMSNIKIIGESKETAKVTMQSHQNPDSAFCGGLIGFIKKQSNYSFALSNVEVANVSVLGLATNTSNYSDPDIFVGGIIGATYFETGSSSTFSNILVYKCDVKAISNNSLKAYAGGITGTVRWSSPQCTFTNCYVESSYIYAKSDSNHDAHSAGFIADIYDIYDDDGASNFYGCVVNNSIVEINTSNGSSNVGGFISNLTNDPTYNLHNCYINANIFRSNTETIRVISPTNTRQSQTYYNSNVHPTSTNNYDNKINLNPFNYSDGFSVFKDANSNWEDFYPILKDTTYFSLSSYSSGSKPTISMNGTNSAALVEIWYSSSYNETTTNSKDNIPTNYSSDYERNKNGWFKLGEVIVYSGTLSDTDPISSYDIKFTDGLYTYKGPTAAEGGNRYLTNVNDGAHKIKSGYLHNTSSTVLVENKFTISDVVDIKVFEGIEDTVIKFRVSSDTPLLVPVIVGSNGQEVSKNPTLVDDYGTYTITSQVLTATVGGETKTYRDYTMVYTPNPEAKSSTFYFAFEIGSSNKYANKVIQVNIHENTKVFESVITAPYTPSINEKEQKDDKDNVIGSIDYPYLLASGTVYKFIPVYSRANDIEDILYDSDTNIQYVTYALGDRADTYVSMGKNGEMTTNSASGTTKLSLTVDYQGSEKTIHYRVLGSNDVNFNIIGYEYEGLVDCSIETNYHLYLNKYDNYHTIPVTDGFKVLRGSTDITKYCQVISNGQNIHSGTEGDYTFDWSKNTGEFEIIVPKGQITADITFNIEFPQVYKIRLHLNNEDFYPGCPVPTIKEYRIVAGTKLSDYFTTDILKEINDWSGKNHSTSTPANSDAYVYGYLFNGFYLVDDASSVNSYGLSFDDYIKTYSATTSIDFYGRWSFLIEIIEAPGTHIVPSFADSFMQSFDSTDYPGMIAAGRVVTVPINANRGYVFTIEKDEDFIGEAAVEAFSIELDGTGKAITSSITIERYHDNAYLYFIPPEKITGYLVIATSVSNSDFIVGENEAALNESIIPEDGIYTFKYVVNHRNDDIKSYIYSGNNINEKRNLRISFEEQVLTITNDGGQITNTLEYMTRTIPVGTVIEIYYHSYIEGSYNNTVVGTYTVTEENVSYVDLSNFTLMNLGGSAFNTEQTFKDYLGSSKSFSEVFYISITPPNGYSEKVQNKIFNYGIDVGYIDSKGDYLVGDRTNKNFANIPLKDPNINLPDYILKESSYQTFLYSITPSRDTELSYDDVNKEYTFKDYKNFDIYSVNISNGTLDTTGEKHYLNLSGTVGSRGHIRSLDEGVGFTINTLSITAGYNEGDLTIYGKKHTDGSWTEIGVISVNQIQYKKYTFNFSGYDYDCFAVVNLTDKEIHIQDLTLTDRANAIGYTLDFSDYEEQSTQYTVHRDIVGDIRHDGKVFMLAVQLGSANGFATNIPSGSKLNIGTKQYAPLDDAYAGRNVLYFNLSSILEAENSREIDFTLTIPTGYTITSVLLYESTSSIKPAMGEVRESFVNGITVNYEFVYKLGSATNGVGVTNPNSDVINSYVSLENPTDGDLVFGGWYLDAEMTKPISNIDTSRGNLTLYGVFYPKDTILYDVTLKYITNGSKEETTVYNVPAGDFVLPTIDDIDKTGYNFSSWDQGNPGKTIQITGDTIINAEYSIKTITLTFKDGNTVYTTITQLYGTTVVSPTNPTKEGCTFAGWSPEVPSTMPGDNQTFTAQWTLKEYTITFNNEDKVHHSEQIQYTKPIELPAEPVRDGYAFVGWDLVEEGNADGTVDTVYETMPAENVTYKAVWVIPYIITYNMNGGGSNSSAAIIPGNSITLLGATRNGYVFEGWYTADTGGTKVGDAGASYTPESNITLYAQWRGCVVTYNANGGTCDTSSQTYEGAALTLPTATREGFKFNGWYTAAEGGSPVGDAGALYTPESNITLYAQWTGYTVTYNPNGGTCDTSSQTYEGAALTLPTATRKGFKFNGWYTAAEGGSSVGDAGASYTPESNITLYAQWTGYTVTYDANGGSVSLTSATYAGTALTLPTPTRTGYTFNGWYTAASGGTKADDPYTPTSDITLYAQWSGCVVEGSLITMADGSLKPVEQLNVGDEILVFNHFTGQIEKSTILINFHDNLEYAYYDVLYLHFSDGTTLGIHGDHYLFNIELNEYVLITPDTVENYLGKEFYSSKFDNLLDKYVGNNIKLVSYDIVTEYTKVYGPTSYGHLNYFAEGLLNINGDTDAFINILKLDENMKVDEELMKKDIEMYGTFTYDDFKDYVSYEIYETYSGTYLKIAIGKGLTTMDRIMELISLYVPEFERVYG